MSNRSGSNSKALVGMIVAVALSAAGGGCFVTEGEGGAPAAADADAVANVVSAQTVAAIACRNASQCDDGNP